jgi:hypothetical protein
VIRTIAREAEVHEDKMTRTRDDHGLRVEAVRVYRVVTDNCDSGTRYKGLEVNLVVGAGGSICSAEVPGCRVTKVRLQENHPLR